MGLHFSLFGTRSKERQLLNRLKVELDAESFTDSFDILAERFYKCRVSLEAKRFAKRKRKYEAVLASDPRVLLRNALATDAGLEAVIASFSPVEIDQLQEALETHELVEHEEDKEHKVQKVETHPAAAGKVRVALS